MESKEKQNIELPENAFQELKDGEEYVPIMGPDKTYQEVTPWSVSWGLIMVVLFSAAAAYLGLKVGQVFEAAIPIAIIAIGLSQATKRKNALGENVIIQSIGACSGAVVAAVYSSCQQYICLICRLTSSRYSLPRLWVDALEYCFLSRSASIL